MEETVETPLTPEQAEMAAEHFEYARALAKSFWRKPKHSTDCARVDDFESAAALGLMRAVRTYDPKRSAIKTWIYKKVRSLCFDLRRMRDRAKREARYVDVDADLLDIRSRENWEDAGEDAGAMIGLLLSAATPREREVFNLYYREGLMESEIAERIGMTLSGVAFHKRVGRQRIREVCGVRGVADKSERA